MAAPTRRRPEVLAPAGDAACLRAAVAAGADAVYFGLAGFNARARATNFDAAELGATMRWLHERGAKGYVTLNTLVFDAELAAVEAATRACADAGVDAVIVQDLGVARLVRAIAPGLPIHASTQMTCTDAASVALAASLGASRVILARELSIEDILAIARATREASQDGGPLRGCSNQGVELEVFVHGALCIAYSGQCLTSEAIGGRSANRGACAQACRLPYELVVDGALRELGDAAYLLSPEDLEASALVPALADAGVVSLKIEGRLKGPEYVAATTLLYRRAVDAACGAGEGPSAVDREAALQAFSRGSGPGFLAGVDHQRLVEGRACDHRGLLAGELIGVAPWRGKASPAERGARRALRVRASAPIARGDGVLVEGGFAGEGELGGRVWGLVVRGADVPAAASGDDVLVWLGPDVALGDLEAGRRVWKTNDPARAVAAAALRDPKRVAMDLRVSGAIGDRPVFEARAGAVRARVEGELAIEEATRTPTTADVLRDKLGRLGETPFALGDLAVELPARAMIPVSSLNRARRALVDALLAAAVRSHPTTGATHASIVASSVPPDRPPPGAGLFVLCRTLEQAVAAADAGADGVVLDFLELTGTGAALRALRAARFAVPVGGRGGIAVAVAPPRIRKPGEEKIDRYLRDLSPDAIVVRGLGALHELAGETDGIPRIGDFSLNVTNRVAAAEVLGRGLAAFTPSFDLDAAQLGDLLDGALAPWAEVVVHHPMPLFHMEHCVIAALLSDGHDHRTCGRPCDRHAVSLRDRAGVDHPVEADVGCRNTVFHAAAQSAASLVPRLQASGVRRFRIELVRERPADVTRIVEAYRALLAGRTSAAAVWRDLRAQGGYGVVRGSLRVLDAPT